VPQGKVTYATMRRLLVPILTFSAGFILATVMAVLFFQSQRSHPGYVYLQKMGGSFWVAGPFFPTEYECEAYRGPRKFGRFETECAPMNNPRGAKAGPWSSGRLSDSKENE